MTQARITQIRKAIKAGENVRLYCGVWNSPVPACAMSDGRPISGIRKRGSSVEVDRDGWWPVLACDDVRIGAENT